MKRYQLIACGALVLSILALAYSTLTQTHTAAASPAPVTAVPLYRFYDRNHGFHFYTADPDERAAMKGDSNWSEEQQEGYVFRQQVPGTLPLYRVGKGGDFGGSEHFYTIDMAQVKEAAPGGWKNEGVACYVSPAQIAGTVPLYRLYTFRGFVYPDGSTAREDDQFYTIDGKQKFEAMAQGYQLVGTEAYVWTQPVTLGASPKPEPPAPLPESYYTDQLLNLGCKKIGGGISCPSPQGYADCESYRKQGKIKAPACLIANFDVDGFNKGEANLATLGCKRFLGRVGEYICETWAGGEACDAASNMTGGLVTKCFTPRMNLVSSYQNSFGREPTAKEVDTWAVEIKAKNLTYKDLMQRLSQYLKTPAASSERKGVANRSVYEAFGRYPEPDEVNNITDKIEKEGTSFAALVKGHIDWMLSDSNNLQGKPIKELSAMVHRAYAAAGLPQPKLTDDWMSKEYAQRLSFKQYVAKLKHGQFPKGAPSK